MRTSRSIKPVSSSNPLRALREQLGSPGKRLSTYKLSELINLPGSTLRAVEAGKNAFTERLQQNLRWRGLNWDPKTRRWSFTYNPDLPLNVDLLTSFYRLSRGSDDFQDIDAGMLCLQVITLLHTVPAPLYSALVLHLRDTLNQLRIEYRAQGAEEIFAAAIPRYSIVETRSGAQTLFKSYSGKSLLKDGSPLDLSGLQKSHFKLGEDEDEQSPSVALPAA